MGKESFTAATWTWNHSDHGHLESIKIETAKQMEGSIKYAVRHMGACLTTSGEWEHEPMPSSRDHEFLSRCRFDTWEQAANTIIEKCEQYGRFTKQIKEAK
jgi:hypothetical protein